MVFAKINKYLIMFVVFESKIGHGPVVTNSQENVMKSFSDIKKSAIKSYLAFHTSWFRDVYLNLLESKDRHPYFQNIISFKP